MSTLLQKTLWRGQPIVCDGAIAFDTETTLIEPGKIPELIVLTCATESQSFIVPPERI